MWLRENGLILLLLIAFVGVFLFAVPAAVFQGYASIDTVLDFARVLLDWPVVVLFLGVFLLLKFESSISAFLSGIGLMRLPGGVEIQAQSPSPDRDEDLPPEGDYYISPEQIQELISAVDEMHQVNEAERKRLEGLLNQAFNALKHWKFSYLSIFYVQHTKHVLYWFAQYPNQTRQTYHESWKQQIEQASERETVLSVLFQYGMIHEIGGRIRVSPEGYAFLRFIGAIPLEPEPQASNEPAP